MRTWERSRFGGGVCHFMVAEIAKKAAEELYEVVMGNNDVRAEWKKQNPGACEEELIIRFVERNWGQCIDFAKRSMAITLNKPNISESIKDQILDALIKDNEVSKSRRGYRRSMH